MASRLNKKIIICCDGTWQNANAGYSKPSLFPYQPQAMLQIPSNVVRINRALVRHDFRGKPQVVYYQAGVGSESTLYNKITGGLTGAGISENIREAYSFITTNYVPGDEIILIGFSRGAYTARAVSGLIHDLGLLTREGMAEFYAIFKDIQNSKNPRYHDLFPNNPFPHKPKGKNMVERYRRRLLENGLTRATDPDGRPIEVLAVAVWDTVGSLGIPSIGWMQRVNIPPSTKELKFYDTNLNSTVRHAFQALALDEHRAPFSPAVWERRHGERTDLRQVWFPGSHGNVGGGYDDQEMANVTLAWMMDQLASVGVEFHDETIDRIYEENRRFYENSPKRPTTASSIFSSRKRDWAVPEIYDKHKPVRPWGLGEIFDGDTGIYKITGRINRTPGRYTRADPDTGKATNHPMVHTNERIHSSVRIRLDFGGLGLDDKGPYEPPSLRPWRLRKLRMKVYDPVPRDANWGAGSGTNGPVANPEDRNDERWIWKWAGPKDGAPRVKTMIEESLGPYERRLLLLSKGREPSRRRRRRKVKSTEKRVSQEERSI